MITSGVRPFALSIHSPAFLVRELLHRQRALGLYGLISLALAIPLLVLEQLDLRLLYDVNVWNKPMKFFVATGLFALTAAWFFGYVELERRASRLMRATVIMLIASASFEVIWITWQGAWGLDSHFNMSSSFYGTMFALMGVSALLLVGTSLPLAWEIFRHPTPSLPFDFVTAVGTGLIVSTVMGAVTGYTMAAHMSHSFGATGGHVPLFGWNRMGGDLRIAHLLAIHAEQAFPLLAWLVICLKLPGRRWIIGTANLCYLALIIATFGQAISGHPLLPL